ncbi:hypothetical protein [Komagataeibacter xylinus]|uniref:Uncharacterized protein n=1 Tax=Komagataeibacter xylinus TaxID=28448 RepID=A0A857FP89_KOMXY|nr:hypothetical protein [Komagataeibacter xylinus]QHC35986.1 hypothetical protein FMA36_11235 [Komagataeibacter xylinus]
MLHGFMCSLFNLGPLGGRRSLWISLLCPCIAQPEGMGRKSAGAEEKNSARNKSIHVRASIMPFVLLTDRPLCSFTTVLPIVRQIAYQSIWMGKGHMPQSIAPQYSVAIMVYVRFSHEREYIFFSIIICVPYLLIFMMWQQYYLE